MEERAGPTGANADGRRRANGGRSGKRNPRAESGTGAPAQARLRQVSEQRGGAARATDERMGNRLERRAPEKRFRRADRFVTAGTVDARREFDREERAESREGGTGRKDQSTRNDQ